MSLLQIRIFCLQTAVQLADEEDTTADIVAAAQEYFSFIACKEHQADKPKIASH